MNDFIIVVKRNPQVQIKRKNIPDKYNRLPNICQLKIVYETLIQSVNLEDMTNLMASTIVVIDIELKMKICRIKYLESRLI